MPVLRGRKPYAAHLGQVKTPVPGQPLPAELTEQPRLPRLRNGRADNRGLRARLADQAGHGRIPPVSAQHRSVIKTRNAGKPVHGEHGAYYALALGNVEPTAVAHHTALQPAKVSHLGVLPEPPVSGLPCGTLSQPDAPESKYGSKITITGAASYQPGRLFD